MDDEIQQLASLLGLRKVCRHVTDMWQSCDGLMVAVSNCHMHLTATVAFSVIVI